MTTRPTPTGPHKLRATAHIRRLAQDVKRTFPDMDVHEHLTDAAREIEAGRHDNAKHHLDAAIAAFAPLQLTRHGIHDDTGHMAGKAFMQRAHRGRLLAADVEHISGANDELRGTKRDAASAAAADKADRRQADTASDDSSSDVPGGAAESDTHQGCRSRQRQGSELGGYRHGH